MLSHPELRATLDDAFGARLSEFAKLRENRREVGSLDSLIFLTLHNASFVSEPSL